MPGTVTSWLDKVRDGDSTAASRLWGYFAPTIMRNLVPKCRNLKICDEEDIAITAFYQLIAALESNEDDQITDRQEFWRLLRTITKRKVCDWHRYDNAKCRGGDYAIFPIEGHSEEQVAKPSEKSALAEPSKGEVSVDSPDPVLTERFKLLVSRMDRPEFETIVELKLQGKNNSEIASRLGLSRRTTQYLISEIKQTWLNTFKAA